MAVTSVKIIVPGWSFSTDQDTLLERRDKLERKYSSFPGFRKVVIETEMVNEVQPIQFYLIEFNNEENALSLAKRVYPAPIDHWTFLVGN